MLRRLFGIAAAILLFTATADAASLLGSYSSMRLGDASVPGLGVGVQWTLAGPLQVTVEATSQFGPVQGEDVDELAVLAGPTFAFRRGRRFVPFVHGKAGFVRSRRQVEILGVAIGPGGVCNGSCPSETGFAAETGGGLDLRLNGAWALRLAQFDYRFTNLASDESDRVRVSAGVAFTWGR